VGRSRIRTRKECRSWSARSVRPAFRHASGGTWKQQLDSNDYFHGQDGSEQRNHSGAFRGGDLSHARRYRATVARITERHGRDEVAGGLCPSGPVRFALRSATPGVTSSSPPTSEWWMALWAATRKPCQPWPPYPRLGVRFSCGCPGAAPSALPPSNTVAESQPPGWMSRVGIPGGPGHADRGRPDVRRGS